MISSLDKLLEQPEKLIANSNIESNSSSGLLIALDTLAENINQILTNSADQVTENTTSVFQQGSVNIAFNIDRKRFVEDVFLVSQTFGNKVFVNFTSDIKLAQITPETSSIIKIPKETFGNSTETMFSYYFKQSSLFLTEKQIQNLYNNGEQIDSFVDSNVLSSTVGFREVKNLTNPIILTFKKYMNKYSSEMHSCQFWKPDMSKFLLVDLKIVTVSNLIGYYRYC